MIDCIRNFLKETLKLPFKHKFVFIHLSAWEDLYEKAKSEEERWINTIHPLLKEAGVKYVFGACFHKISFTDIDGINYITMGKKLSFAKVDVDDNVMITIRYIHE